MTGEEEQIGGFDIVYKNGNRTKPNVAARADRNPHVFMMKEYSLLGCFNNRDQNMRRMAKMAALRLADEAKKAQDTRVDSVKNRGRNPASTQNRTSTNNQVAGSVSNRQNIRGRSVAMGPPQQPAATSTTNSNNISTRMNSNPINNSTSKYNAVKK